MSQLQPVFVEREYYTTLIERLVPELNPVWQSVYNNPDNCTSYWEIIIDGVEYRVVEGKKQFFITTDIDTKKDIVLNTSCKKTKIGIALAILKLNTFLLLKP